MMGDKRQWVRLCGTHPSCPAVTPAETDVNSLSPSWARRRYRRPLGKAARAILAVSEDMRSKGLGPSTLSFHVSIPTLPDAEAADQGSKDFASSITFDAYCALRRDGKWKDEQPHVTMGSPHLCDILHNRGRDVAASMALT
jgi:hypothetical protein